LIELLTVIAIIGVLAGLLFPTIKSAFLKAEVAKAQQGVNGLATAFKSYYTEYGKWPIAYPSMPLLVYEDLIVDKDMVALLSGDDVGGASVNYPGPTLYHPTVDTGFGSSYGPSSAAIQGNTRKIVFLEFKKADLDSSGSFVDPWGKPYHFRLDVNYQNWIDNPFFSSGTQNTVTNGFLVWSIGPDGQYNQAGDGIGVNKDNIKSW